VACDGSRCWRAAWGRGYKYLRRFRYRYLYKYLYYLYYVYNPVLVETRRKRAAFARDSGHTRAWPQFSDSTPACMQLALHPLQVRTEATMRCAGMRTA
jgi:hypothetical protein